MIEIISDAIVLHKEDLGEYDSYVALYTEKIGKVNARATALRKITSKLAAHLEPLNHVSVRLISRRDSIFDARGFQLADALIINKPNWIKRDQDNLREVLRVFYLMSKIIPDGALDADLWNLFYNIHLGGVKTDINSALKLMGFDRRFASCELCGSDSVSHFLLGGSTFVCRLCILRNQILRSEFIKLI